MRRCRGVSLLEFIMAATLLAIVSTAVLTLLVSSRLLVSETELAAQADLLCFSILEEQKDRTFSDLIPGTQETLPEQKIAGAYIAVPTIEVRSLPDVDDTRLVEILVTVVWDSNQIRHETSHSALVANLPR